MTERALEAAELRALVREVVRDAYPQLAAGAPVGTPGPPEPVSLGSDAELDAFVRRLAKLCADPERRAELESGRQRFRLAVAPPAPAQPPVRRVEQGAVTEAQVKAAAATGARLLLGRRAVLTPLARDKARTLGVTVERER